MKTYTEFVADHADCFFWDCDAGEIDGNRCLDVLVYESEEDMDRDVDNSLAIARETVIDDIYHDHDVTDCLSDDDAC